jgi:hypothetical protein
MKTKPDHDDLLADTLSATDDARAVSLERTLAYTRRVRRTRVAIRAVACVAVFVAAISMVWQQTAPANLGHERRGPIASHEPVVRTVPGTTIRVLTDEELLAMFPNRPIALIGPADARQFVLLDEPNPAPDPGS